MADLDDFFAKKDRKKSKGKKFSTTDEVAKKLEDTTKKVEKTVKKDRPEGGDETTTPTHGEYSSFLKEQDEWKEYEEEKKDYTGLKIGNLTLGAEESGGGTLETNSAEQPGEEVLGGEVEMRAPGPWRRKDEPDAVPEEVPPQPPPPVAAPSPAPTPGAYVAPGMRGHTQQQSMQPARLRSRGAPDIHSEEYFPSLSSTKAEQKKTKAEGSFEMVAHGRSSSYRQAEQSKLASSEGPKLTLGNRYNTLSNDS